MNDIDTASLAAALPPILYDVRGGCKDGLRIRQVRMEVRSHPTPARVQVAGHSRPAVDVLPDALKLGRVLKEVGGAAGEGGGGI